MVYCPMRREGKLPGLLSDKRENESCLTNLDNIKNSTSKAYKKGEKIERI